MKPALIQQGDLNRFVDGGAILQKRGHLPGHEIVCFRIVCLDDIEPGNKLAIRPFKIGAGIDANAPRE